MVMVKMCQFNEREVSAKWPFPTESSVQERIRAHSPSILTSVTEVFLQHQKRNQLFPLLVAELIDESVSVSNNGFGLLGMSAVITDLLFEVRIVVFERRPEDVPP